jgi:hypothetical protein
MGERERHGAGIFFCGTAELDLAALLAGDDPERDAIRALVDEGEPVYEFAPLPALGPGTLRTCLSLGLLPAGPGTPWRDLIVGTYVVTLAPLTEAQLAGRNLGEPIGAVEELRRQGPDGRHYWQLRNVWVDSITPTYEPLELDGNVDIDQERRG